MEKNITVGQKVYIDDGRYASRNKGIQEATVTKVGRKYFHVTMSQWDTERFFLENLRHDNGGYASRIKLYLSLQEYLDTQQNQYLWDAIRQKFIGYTGKNMDLQKLKQIAAILGIEEWKA